MNCIKWRWVAWIIRIIGVVVVIVGVKNAHDLLTFIGSIIVIVSAKISFDKWKCPHCELPLKENMSIFTQYCPYCGESLDE